MRVRATVITGTVLVVLTGTVAVTVVVVTVVMEVLTRTVTGEWACTSVHAAVMGPVSECAKEYACTLMGRRMR